MVEIKPMTIILTVILLICAYLAIVQTVNALSHRSDYTAGNTLLIDVVIAIMYLVVCGAVGLIYIYSGYDMNVIYVTLAFGVLIAVILFIRYCIRNRFAMRKLNVVLFLAYFAVVLYLTIFQRIGSVDTSVVTVPFDDLRLALVNHDPAMLEHMLLNILLFVPFGYLIPAMSPDRLRKCSFAFLGGVACSTVIEGIQMIFYLGQSDIDDVIANSIGAVTGYLIVRFVWKLQENWRLR